VLAVEGAADEALIDTTSGAEEGEGEHGKPESPVEDLLGFAQVSELEDIDWLLDAARHASGVLFSE
jgi:hypothetical protein